MEADILQRVKLSLRISHTVLDEDISADIDACIADLKICGVVNTSPADPLIFNAVKLYCRAQYTDDTAKAAAYMERYNALKSCLMMAEGYGWEDTDD